MTSALPFSPASERNREPILAALRPWLAPAGSALEIASGTGQHMAHFAHALPDWHWQPSDVTADLFAAIVARTADLPRVAAPVRLDARDAPWPSDGPAWDKPFDLIFAANMLHIAPWACTPALMRGAARHLAPSGRLVTYGPYFEADVPTPPSNLAFDADLRARHPDWGIRERAAVEREAHAAGLRLAHRAALPANNLLLVFERG